MADNLILMWQTALKWAVTALLAGGVSFVTVRYKLRKEHKNSATKTLQDRLESLDKRDELFSASLRSVLRQDIIDAYDRYTVIGWARIYVKDNVQEMYDCYNALGGKVGHGINIAHDGTLAHLVEEIMQLPTREEDKR